jgi:N-formylglutamate deformylase
MLETYRFRAGRTPLLVSMPHTGMHVPEWLMPRLTRAAKALPDTDWHLESLYDFLEELGASVLVATHSRYVVDLNRPPDNVNLYPGHDTTDVVPIDTFHKEPLYLPGFGPSQEETRSRIEQYWKPYHAKLADELARLKKQYGYALLWDAHSILSVVPRFFPGKLTDFNLGTADGRSCGPGLGEALLKTISGYSKVLNGRFKGGYITRTYGEPANRVHTVQLELSEAIYMEEQPPFRFREHMAQKVRPSLRDLLEEMLAFPRA